MIPADLMSMAFLVITLTLILASVGVWIQLGRRVHQGWPLLENRFRHQRVRVPRFPLALTLAALLLNGLSSLLLSTSDTPLTVDQIRLVVQTSMSEGLIVFTILAVTLTLGVRSQSDLIRLGFRWDHLGQQLKEGVLGFVAALAPVSLLLILSSPIRTEENAHPFLRLLKEAGWGPELSTIAITAVIIAPLREELMFRVILQSWLEEFCPGWLAITISSTIFAAVHRFPDSLALIPLALVLGYLFQKRRSYLAVVTVHALFNLYNLYATLNTE